MAEKKTLKIAVLTEIINTHSGARAPLEIARHLALLGHQITIYAYDRSLDTTLQTELAKSGITVKLFKLPSSMLLKYFLILPLGNILRKDAPDVAYFSGTPPFFLAAYFTGIPVVRMYQGTQFDALLETVLPGNKISQIMILLNKFANILIYLIDFMSFRLSREVVAISRYAKDEGEKLYKRNVKAVIYHGTSLFPDRKKHPKNKSHRIEILSVSRLTPYKGFHVLIRALKTIRTTKKIRLTIIGSQPKTNYLKWLRKLGGKMVKFVIDPSDQKLNFYYKNSDIYVTADKYLYFGMPITEAAQFATPTVALNFAAAGEIVKHRETGLVANNFSELKKYLKILIENDKLRFVLGKNAEVRVKNFTWKKTAKRWEKILLQAYE